jgi:hypothetical protein
VRYGAKGRLGQLRRYHGSCTLHRKSNFAQNKARPKVGPKQIIDDSTVRDDHDSTLQDIRYWERRLLKAKAKDGTVAISKLFHLFSQQKRYSQLLAHSAADGLRNSFLALLQDDDAQLAKLVHLARELQRKFEFTWPDLYEKTIYSFLSRSMYAKALAWHWRLAPDLLPTSEMFGGLLAEFAANDDAELQDTLEKLYILQLERQLYDVLIPTLYTAGRLKQALSWRRRLLNHQDHPVTPKSRPFLCFLQRYYPGIQLTEDELRIAEAGAEASEQQHQHLGPETEGSAPSDESYSESLLAKWLATRWMPLDFIVNFVFNMGVRSLGPRALQSLALREPNAKDVAERISAMEKRGIMILRHVYSDALIHFAQHGDDNLLSLLLHSDIHPKEFDSPQRRRALLTASRREHDTQKTALLQGIEAVVEHKAKPDTLTRLLEEELWKGGGKNHRWALQWMKELKMPITQSHAKRFLQDALDQVSMHSNQSDQNHKQLTMAIDTIRIVSRHDVGIPVWCWKKVLTALGRTDRLDELERLSLEIVDLFQPHRGGLIPVYRKDVPGLYEQPSGDPVDDSRLMPREWSISDATDADHAPGSAGDRGYHRQHHDSPIDEEQDFPEPKEQRVPGEPEEEESRPPEYIPAGLPFHHHEHPLNKIFDVKLQRSIIRWGFEKTLLQRPKASSLQGATDDDLATYDLARGVRILALLRNHGVDIRTDAVRSAVIVRIALNEFSGRRKSHARDTHEMLAENLKPLFDTAWGSELLPESSVLRDEVDRQKLVTWKRYPRLFERNMDHNYDGTKQALESQAMYD